MTEGSHKSGKADAGARQDSHLEEERLLKNSHLTEAYSFIVSLLAHCDRHT